MARAGHKGTVCASFQHRMYFRNDTYGIYLATTAHKGSPDEVLRQGIAWRKGEPEWSALKVHSTSTFALQQPDSLSRRPCVPDFYPSFEQPTRYPAVIPSRKHRLVPYTNDLEADSPFPTSAEPDSTPTMSPALALHARSVSPPMRAG